MMDLVLTLTMMMMALTTLGVTGVKITEVSIPRTVEIGQENIILNCDYHFDQEEAQQLEIKWYFNKDPSPFFQWIAGLPDAKVGIHILILETLLNGPKPHKYL